MKPVTIITGSPASGKTTLAKNMCEGKKSIWLSSLDSHSFSEINIDTDIVVIDGLATKSNLEKLKSFYTAEKIIVEKQLKDPVKIERPELIIISNSLKKEDFNYRPYIKFIEK